MQYVNNQCGMTGQKQKSLFVCTSKASNKLPHIVSCRQERLPVDARTTMTWHANYLLDTWNHGVNGVTVVPDR